MKNQYCDIDETLLHSLETPKLATGLLTSPFRSNGTGWVQVPEDTFKQFVDCVAAYVLHLNGVTPPDPARAAVESAHKEGKAVEYRSREDRSGRWLAASTPTWNWTANEYRVKP